jgi:ferredoxin
MLLREVDGNNNKSCDTCKVKLDENLVDKSEVEKKQEDRSVRIIETNPNEFKTLKHLKE